MTHSQTFGLSLKATGPFSQHTAWDEKNRVRTLLAFYSTLKRGYA